MSGLDAVAARAALAPVRRVLLSTARERARELIADADRDGARLLARARRSADSLLAQARAAGATDAAAARSERVSVHRRAARAAELAAARSAYLELCRQVRARIADWCAGPGHLAVLAARVRELLGPDATVCEVPGGGVIGIAAGRRLELDVATIAGLGVDALGADVAKLWSV